jgi:integrase
MNEFKTEMVLVNKWDRLGINSSHDLRRFFVSDSITKSDRTPFQIAQITGHNIVTMEKFYIRDNMKEKFNHFKEVSQKELLKKFK